MVKALDCGIVVNDFELQLRYYVNFRTNTLGNYMDPLIIPYMGARVVIVIVVGNGHGDTSSNPGRD